MEEFKTSCRGCHGGCMFILSVENGRVVKARPDPNGPLNRGKACPKGLSVVEQMYHPERLIYPMHRIGPKCSGKWGRISWDEAYQEIADKLTQFRRESGPESIALTTGTGRHHLAQYWRFANVLETPNATSSGALICLGPRKNAGDFTTGVFAGVDYYGDVKPGGILVWGANPAISGADGELQWHIKDAAKRGTPLIIVDPQPTELTAKATLWLKPRPGTDGALALGILNVIIQNQWYDRDFVENWTVGFAELAERCQEYPTDLVSRITWVPEEDIVEAARLISSIKPLSLEWGCAIEQCSNAFQTCRAIYMLPLITGNWDVPGGFVPSKEIAPSADPMFGRLSPEQGNKIISGDFPLNNGKASPKMFAHPWLTFEAMRTGTPYKIRALLSHANNSLLSMPDAGHVYECLKKIEFFVYMDFYPTPTGEFADILLPAALWPELDSLYPFPEFGDQALLCQQKVAQVGECKDDETFFLELCQRMGLDYGAESQREILDGCLEEMGKRYPQYAGMDFEGLKQQAYVVPPRTYYNYRTKGFHTPTGKAELYSARVRDSGGDPLPYWKEDIETPVSRPDLAKEYPLVLTTGGRRQPFFVSNNRQIRSLRKQWPFPRVTIHPETAARYGIQDGEWVWIENQRGKITQKARLDSGIDPRLINCEMGWWYPEAGAPGFGWAESNVNILTRGEPPCDPFGGSYPLRGLLCKIAPNPDCTIEARYRAWIAEPVESKPVMGTKYH